MERRTLGGTGLEISALGVGMAELGFQLDSSEADRAAAVLNAALDLGISFIDTAGCYGNAEEFIGRTISGRRDEFVLSSKTGHMSGACGDESWSYACVTASIDRSLERMKTDRVDVMHLHSCGVDVLERGEAIRALTDARDAGKVRFVAYSGDNDAVLWAAKSGHFDVIQTSFNLVDQRARYELFADVTERNLGLIAKRPILNGVWRVDRDPDPYHNGYASEYFSRQNQMTSGTPRFPGEPEDPIFASLGFTLAHEPVDVAIIGTKNESHMRSNIEMVERLPVPDEFVRAAEKRFDEVGSDWEQRG
ncbi:MAG: aldo/keto reductase [Spirochaetota bacterium]